MNTHLPVAPPRIRQCGLPAAVGVALLCCSSLALAQLDQEPEVLEIATDQPPSSQPRSPESPPVTPPYDWKPDPRGLRLGAGPAFTSDVDPGWYGRLELAVYDNYRAGSGGAVITIGGEGWLADGAGGGSVPLLSGMVLELGVLHLSFGLGFDILLLDKIDDATGWGLFGPVAGAAVGLNFSGFRILADGRARYRWQFGADDHSQGLVGLALEIEL